MNVRMILCLLWAVLLFEPAQSAEEASEGRSKSGLDSEASKAGAEPAAGKESIGEKALLLKSTRPEKRLEETTIDGDTSTGNSTGGPAFVGEGEPMTPKEMSSLKSTSTDRRTPGDQLSTDGDRVDAVVPKSDLRPGRLKGTVTTTRLARPIYPLASEPATVAPLNLYSGDPFNDLSAVFSKRGGSSTPTSTGHQSSPGARAILHTLSQFVGSFGGALNEGRGADLHQVRTILELRDGKLSGEYQVESQDGVNGQVSKYSGTLEVIEVIDRSARFRWNDRYGTGTLIIYFDSSFNQFTGQWYYGNDLDGRSWNGSRVLSGNGL